MRLKRFPLPFQVASDMWLQYLHCLSCFQCLILLGYMRCMRYNYLCVCSCFSYATVFCNYHALTRQRLPLVRPCLHLGGGLHVWIVSLTYVNTFRSFEHPIAFLCLKFALIVKGVYCLRCMPYRRLLSCYLVSTVRSQLNPHCCLPVMCAFVCLAPTPISLWCKRNTSKSRKQQATVEK